MRALRLLRGQPFEVRFVIPIWEEYALVWTEVRVALEVNANRRWCGENKPRPMSNRFTLDPPVDAPSKPVLWVVLFSHGITEIHDPRFAAEDMQEISNQNGTRDRISSEDNVNVVLPDAI